MKNDHDANELQRMHCFNLYLVHVPINTVVIFPLLTKRSIVPKQQLLKFFFFFNQNASKLHREQELLHLVSG